MSSIRKSLTLGANCIGFLLVNGCVTDEGGSKPAPTAAAGPRVRPEGVHTVRTEIDSNPPAAWISLNGVEIGMTPRTVHFEVDDNGFMAYPVTIGIRFQEGSSQRALMAEVEGRAVSSRPQDMQFNFPAGRIAPATMTFDNGHVLYKGRAPWDTKPTNPDARQR